MFLMGYATDMADSASVELSAGLAISSFRLKTPAGNSMKIGRMIEGATKRYSLNVLIQKRPAGQAGQADRRASVYRLLAFLPQTIQSRPKKATSGIFSGR